jgi:hypothetical protein
VEFREYLENELALELRLFEGIYQEDPDWMSRTDESLLDIAKGVGGVIKGAVQSGSGLMSMGDEALARAVGDPTKGRMKGGWNRFAKGIGNIGGGLRQAVVGSPSKSQPKNTEAQPRSAGSSRPQPQNAEAQPAPKQTATQPSEQVPPGKKEPLKFSIGKDEKIDSSLQGLVDQYQKAKSWGERNRILAVISMKHSAWYQEKLKQAKNRQFAKSLAVS